MTAPTTVRPSPWKGGICPRGAITGQSPQVLAARAGRSPAAVPVRSHRRSGVERAELVAAGLAGSATTVLIFLFIEKVIRRG